MKTRTLIRDKVVNLRLCEVCRSEYTPRWVEQRTCGGRCARVLGGRQNLGQVPPAFAAAIERRRQAKQAYVERHLSELTEREQEIFLFARRLGYNEGYAKGLLHQRRQKATAA